MVIVGDHSQSRRWRRRGPQNVGFAMNIGGAISGRIVSYFVCLINPSKYDEHATFYIMLRNECLMRESSKDLFEKIKVFFALQMKH